MPKLVTWMNNQRVGELTKLANGAHTFKYAPEWLASRYARPLSLSLPLQRGNITSDAVFNFFDNLLPDSPIVRDRIVKRYHAKSRQPFDLLSEIGRDSVGAWICPYISRHLLSLNPLLACCRRYSRG
ncbi:HipA N-terminal domain-containing protein, partial [Escherichia coli]|uniref:HipA N-terminal domain-containing protein n=1 Tax=Escherichia coli TaxID=562 RepID=UPI00313CA155